MPLFKKKQNKVNTKNRNEIEVEEIFLENLSAGDKEGETDYLDRRLEYPIYPKIFEVLLAAVFLIFAAVIAGSLSLSLFKNDFYLSRAEKNITQTVYLPASRGLIFDRFGEKLVENVPYFEAVMTLADLPKEYVQRMVVVEKARKILKLDGSYLNNLISWADFEEQKTIIIKEDLSHDEAVALESQSLEGIKAIVRNRRNYKDGPVFSHILGFIGREEEWREVGRSGLENFYDFLLSGLVGEKKILKPEPGSGNSAFAVQEDKNRDSFLNQVFVKEAIAGENLTLTIDAGLQRFSFNRLKEALNSYGSPAGAVAALDPRNGEILSLVSLPSYDNNLFSKGISEKEFNKLEENSSHPLFNRVISGLYAPASTIKPLIALAALEEKIIDPLRKINDSDGLIRVPNPYNPDKPTIFNDWKIHGFVDMRKALSESCDVYFYTIGGGYGGIAGLGIDKIIKYIDNFNLGSRLGVDFPQEEAGKLPDPSAKEKKGDIWRVGDTYNISIGQGEFLVTPLQIISYMGAMANGGIVYQPHFFLSEFENSDTRINADKSNNADKRGYPRKKEPIILKNNLININNLKVVQEGMRMVVSSPMGTAYLLNSLPFKTAGKSGTAEVIKNEKINAFFAAYAPYEEPEIVLLVLIEGAPEGILSATPVAYDILNWWWENRIKTRI